MQINHIIANESTAKMVYQEFLPTALLKDHVEVFWSLKSLPGEVVDYRSIFPDACADIIFNFGSPLLSGKSGVSSVNSMKCFLVGTMTQPAMSKPTISYDLMGVRFRPGGLFSFLKIPLNELTNERIGINNFPEFRNLYEQLVNLRDTQLRISFIEKIILTKVTSSNPLMLWSVRQLEESNGVIAVQQLALKAGVSQKKLERTFQEAVGVSPKSLAGIFQFMKSRELLAHSHSPDLLSIALACGYYDHAHFTKTFKTFSGMTPEVYRKQQTSKSK